MKEKRQLSYQEGDHSFFKKSHLKVYARHQQSRIDSLKQDGDILKASLVARNMAFSAPFNKDKAFLYLYEDLKSGTGYARQLNHLKKCITDEMNARQPYINAFMTKDTVWWRNEIKKVNEIIKAEKDSYTKDMYQRIKALWGIACYSLCKQAVGETNADMLQKIIPVYHMLEPENPDVFYFSALLSLWEGEKINALVLLRKARQLGFSDMSRQKRDFPESFISEM